MKNSKMKIVVGILLLLNICSLSAQVFRGEVIYKQRAAENVFDSTAIKKIGAKYVNTFDFINKSLEKYSGDFEFSLKFNNKESIYELVEKMRNEDDRGYKIASNYSRIKDISYLNIQNGEKLVQMESFGEQFVIKYDLDSIKWKLFNKTKVIENYKCYMASTVKIVKNSKGSFEKPVIAWYTPEIPLNFGPKGYGGLPGLILELQEDKLNYYVTKILLNPNEAFLIVKPNKGKHLTKNEFELKQKEMSSNFWKGK